MSRNVLRFSHFPDDPFGDGGAKRTAQISEILSMANLKTTWYNPDISGIKKKSFAAVDGIQVVRKHKIACANTKTALTQLGFNYFKTATNLRYYDAEHRVMLWESTRQKNFVLPFANEHKHLTIVAMPHNIESLVAGQPSEFTGKMAPDWFSEELHSLRKCTHVVAISPEDQLLLQLFGIQASLLPYFPPEPVQRFLESIRAQRTKNVSSNKLLLLGTAGNYPTFEGMLASIKLFQSAKNNDLELHVAGYLTEMLRGHFEADEHVVLHGTVSQEGLAGLLTTCKAVWINQPPSTGALTRLPEMMLAGVPVIINQLGAKSWIHWPGVLPFTSNNQLFSIWNQERLPEPGIPSRPIEAEMQFLKLVESIV